MMSTNRIALKELGSALPNQITALICSGSYEERCLSIPSALSKLPAFEAAKALVCYNQRSVVRTGKNTSRLIEILGASNCERVPLDRSNPVRTADSMNSAISRLFDTSRAHTLLVDITTFTHEALLILLKLLQSAKRKRDSIFLVYSPAAEYSVGLSPADKWLSRGIRSIRSVLGYPGELRPSLRSHLIILLGFESDRAERLLDEFQPSVVSIGVGRTGSSTDVEHEGINRMALGLMAARVRALDVFEFSCVEITDTERSVVSQIHKYPDCNVFVAPMNTKLSTVGVAGAAFRQKAIQICYASASQYNVEGYSRPSEQAMVVELHEDFWRG